MAQMIRTSTYRSVTSDRPKLALLPLTRNSFHRCLQRQLANFVEEYRAAIREVPTRRASFR